MLKLCRRCWLNVSFWFIVAFFSPPRSFLFSVLAATPSAKPAKRVALKDITNKVAVEEELDPSDGRVESCPKSMTFAKFEYRMKNVNKERIEFICKFRRSKRKGCCKDA